MKLKMPDMMYSIRSPRTGALVLPISCDNRNMMPMPIMDCTIEVSSPTTALPCALRT